MNCIRPLIASFALCLSAGMVPAGHAASEPAEADGRHDFDFFHGHWTSHNRRMLKPLSGAPQWEEFDSASHCVPMLGGLANQDDFTTPHRPGFIGMSFRFFDAKSRRWSIYWIDNRSVILQPPVVGRFEADLGVFEGPDTFDGRPITVRYTWSKTRSAHPRWEQAFSTDGGKTWETNWVADFTREDGR